MDPRVAREKKEYESERKERDCFVPIWEDVGYFVFRRAYSFVGGTLSKAKTNTLGAFAQFSDVYADEAMVAVNKLSSALLGMMYKNGARTFKVKRPASVSDRAENKAFYDNMNVKVTAAIEHPRARFISALGEDMREQVGWGVGGAGVFFSGDVSAPLSYKSYNIRNCTLIENEAGLVDGCYIEETLPRSKVIERYGERALPPKPGPNYDPALDAEMVTFLHVVKPNKEYVEGSLNVTQLRYMSFHFELTSGNVLRDSGYNDNPIKWSRLEKNSGEVYSRSPCIDTLPSTYALCESIRQYHLGSEKDNKPPKALLDDGNFGGGTLNMSPGAFNVIDVSGRISGVPIIDLHTPVNRQTILLMIQQLKDSIHKGFFLDQILDLNNKARQTLGEAEIRNEIRSEPLAAMVCRMMEEKQVPLLETSVSMLYELGTFGVVPGSDLQKRLVAAGRVPTLIPPEIAKLIVAGEDFYDFQFISPAARMMRAEELRGVRNAVMFAVDIQPVDPKPLMRYDMGKVMTLVNELEGVPESVMKSKEDYDSEVDAYTERQATIDGIQANSLQAKIGKDNAAAAMGFAQAQALAAGGNGSLGAGGNPSGV